MATAERRVVDSFWDLRDDAYDHPDRWLGVSPEATFQRLAEFAEAAEARGRPTDWSQDVVERMIAWREAEAET